MNKVRGQILYTGFEAKCAWLEAQCIKAGAESTGFEAKVLDFEARASNLRQNTLDLSENMF
jgi:hypothetical protein